MLRGSNKNNSNNKITKSIFHHFCPRPPSIAHIPSRYVMRYIVLDGFYPWVRGGSVACSGGQDGLQCSGDAHPSNRAQHTVGTLKLPFFWAILLPWIFLASTVYGIVIIIINIQGWAI